MTEMKYTMQWDDYAGHSYMLYIYDTQAEAAYTPVALTPAENPFITEISSDNNTLQPVREGSAKLSFIGNWEDIVAIDLSGSVRYRVELEKDEDEIKWRGWLKADVYEQDFCSEKGTITLNCIDDVAALACFDMSAEGDALPTLGELLAECFGHIGDFEVRIASNIFNPDTILALRIARANYIAYNSDGEIQPKKCSDFVADFCTTFGLSLHQEETALIFSRPSAVSFSDYFTLADVASATSVGEIVRNQKYASDLSPTDTDHSIAMEQGYRRVNVKASLNKIADDDSYLPNLKNAGLTLSDAPAVEQKLPAWYKDGKHHTDGKWVVRAINMERGKMYRWKWNGAELEEFPLMPDSFDVPSFLNMTYGGCQIVSDDYWEASATDAGSSETDLKKKSYQFKTRIYASSFAYDDATDSYQFLGNYVPILRLEGKREIIVSSGGFDLNFRLHKFFSGPRQWPMKNGLAIPAPISRYRLAIKLSIGEYTWGIILNRWEQSLFSSGEIYMKPQQDYQLAEPEDTYANYRYNIDAQNVAIPLFVPEGVTLRGLMTLEIQASFPNESSPIVLEDLDIRYAEPSLTKFEDGQETTALKSAYDYTRKTEGSTADFGDVELHMHTARDGQSAYSNLYQNGHPLEEFYDGSRLENTLADLYESEIMRTRTYVCITAKDGEISYLDKLAISGQKYVNVCSLSTNWRTNESTYQFVEL